jgi:uncharacterized protein YbjT (DUF2867 family)
MQNMGKTAIVLGATGLTGGLLTRALLNDDRYACVKLISRKSIGESHPKLQEHCIDMTALLAHKNLFTADELFCCIGTTKAKTPDEAAYRKIDFDIPLNAAKLCKQNGIPTFVVMSSLGADPNSKVFYSRLKGQMETEVLNQGIEKVVIVRPSLISGYRNEKRLGELWAKRIMKLLNPLLFGPLKVYRSIHPQCIAKAMLWLANALTEKTVFLSDELQTICSYDS